MRGGTHQSLFIRDSEFYSNVVLQDGDGGAVNAGTFASDLQILNVTFMGNAAKGISCGCGALAIKTQSTGFIKFVSFSDNSASSRGGALCLSGTIGFNVTRTTFSNNSAECGAGGGFT